MCNGYYARASNEEFLSFDDFQTCFVSKTCQVKSRPNVLSFQNPGSHMLSNTVHMPSQTLSTMLYTHIMHTVTHTITHNKSRKPYKLGLPTINITLKLVDISCKTAIYTQFVHCE